MPERNKYADENKVFKNVGDDIDANSSYRDYSSRNSNLFDN